MLTVTTGNLVNAGTNAKVFVCITGELGETGPLRLKKSGCPFDGFAEGQTDTFAINAPNVGKVSDIINFATEFLERFCSYLRFHLVCVLFMYG